MSDSDRPRYGEYAPGYVPPAPGSEPAPAGPPPAAAPAWSTPPQYGQAPGYGAPQSSSAPQWDSGSGRRPRRTWDVVITVILLVLGLVGTAIALVYAGVFSDPALLDEVFRQQGRGDFNGQVGSAPLIIAVSHIALLVVAVGLSILFLVKRLVAFWIPLAAGVIAAAIFWGTLASVFMSDPGFTSRLGG